jgi:hypothetical protein
MHNVGDEVTVVVQVGALKSICRLAAVEVLRKKGKTG